VLSPPAGQAFESVLEKTRAGAGSAAAAPAGPETAGAFRTTGGRNMLDVMYRKCYVDICIVFKIEVVGLSF
jgi:hypothetical protein